MAEMTLSEAIRIGAKKRPRQAFFVTYDAATDATCALGAAADALGILDLSQPNAYTGEPPLRWKPFVKRETVCPVCRDVLPQVDSCVIHLNNWHHWTRERIADFVETLEKAFASTR